ncbi:unnamed protein product [Linum tenue]|uniref:Cytochrome P450 n=1 Tax=Linum tenue TaxID=586396 RepID=A0AAV0GPX5_9ROSI|nr:unnamed protein product [Linum tenue]
MEEINEILFSNNPPLLIIILITTLIILFSTISFLKKQNKKQSNKNRAATFPLPPGPWKLPIIGNIHQSSSALIHRRFAELSQHYGPVMHLQLGETSNVVLSSPESASEFLKTHDQNFAIRPYMPSGSIICYGGRDIVFSSEGDYWRRMKRICTTELLSKKRVTSLRFIREEEADKLVQLIGRESAAGGGGAAVNLSRLLFAVSNTMTSRTAFGKVRELEESFLPVMHRILQTLGGFSIGDLFPSNRFLRLISGTERELNKLHQEIDVIIQGIVDEHLSRRRRRETEHHDIAEAAEEDDNDEDLVDVLLASTNNHLEAKAIIMAGGETSPVTVAWAMSELMRNPEKMEKAQREARQLFDRKGGVVDESCLDELHYLKSVIKETLRMHPAVPLSIPREGVEAVVINGYRIPTKTRVIVNYWAIGRDPSYWTQPDEFMPERFLDSSVDYKGFDFQLIPFGAGRRLCPGINYGIAVVSLLLANLIYHFDWKLPNQLKPQDLDMFKNLGVSASRKNDLYLNPIPYHAP